MNDNYQAVFDAVRSRFPTVHIPDIESIIAEKCDISQAVSHIEESMKCWINCPSVWYRPKLFMDGNKWCALYGDNLQDGIVGFGDSPSEAMNNFDTEWYVKINPMKEGE